MAFYAETARFGSFNNRITSATGWNSLEKSNWNGCVFHRNSIKASEMMIFFSFFYRISRESNDFQTVDLK